MPRIQSNANNLRWPRNTSPHRALPGTTAHFSSFARNQADNFSTPPAAKNASSKSRACPLTSLRTPFAVTSAGFSRPISPNRQSFIVDSSQSRSKSERSEFVTTNNTESRMETLSSLPIPVRTNSIPSCFLLPAKAHREHNKVNYDAHSFRMAYYPGLGPKADVELSRPTFPDGSLPAFYRARRVCLWEDIRVGLSFFEQFRSCLSSVN